jgi:transposase-like protein
MSPQRAEMGRNGPAGPSLTPKQEAAAFALAGGATLDQAARKSGAGVTTVKRWLNDQPALRQRIRELRAALTDRALGKLADAMTTAANTLLHLCMRGRTENVRLKASEALLTHGVKIREAVELEARIAALEANHTSAGRRIA